MAQQYTTEIACPQLVSTQVKGNQGAREGYELYNAGPSTIRVASVTEASATTGEIVPPSKTVRVMRQALVNNGGANGGVWEYAAAGPIRVFPLNDRNESGGPKTGPTKGTPRDNIIHLHELRSS